MSKSIKIMLVEDNPADVELTREALCRGKVKNDMVVASNGEQALDMIFQRSEYADLALPDIILLDLNLPKVDGREVLTEIKADPDRCSIPVIILSSSSAAQDIQQTYQLHANCFITKPVQLSDFLKVIEIIETFWIDIVRLPGKDE